MAMAQDVNENGKRKIDGGEDEGDGVQEKKFRRIESSDNTKGTSTVEGRDSTYSSRSRAAYIFCRMQK